MILYYTGLNKNASNKMKKEIYTISLFYFVLWALLSHERSKNYVCRKAYLPEA